MERFLQQYKVKKEHGEPLDEVVKKAVKSLMDDILDGIVKTFPDNPTLPDDRSGANTPSTLYITVYFHVSMKFIIN